MRTSKPISTISYNSAFYLEGTLNEMLRSHVITFWACILHKAEEDEKREHWHVYMEPNKMLDTAILQDRFIESVYGDKPLKCLPFQSSNSDDWILYSEHNEEYLLSKQEMRRYHYGRDDFYTSDDDYFDELYRHAHVQSKWATERKKLHLLRDMMNEGENPANLVYSGLFSVKESCGINALMRMGNTFRNGRKGHEEDN